MSRSGYSDDVDGWELIRWRGAVKSAMKGKRGQALFREMLSAFDAMPEKVLVANDLEADGKYCALGVVGNRRGIPLSDIDTEDYEAVADAFYISCALAQEIMYENDEGGWRETPEHRWQRMRNWVIENIREQKSE